MRKLRSSFSRPVASVLCCTVAAVVAFVTPAPARGHAQARPSVPPTAECWTVTGPHGSGNEVYFDASNNCPEPRHCRVWVNWHEPPSQVHLDIGMKGHIDIGKTEPGDKFSYDCVPVSPGM